MPAWNGVLDDAQIWKLTTFPSHVSKLPPAVDQQWRQAPKQQPHSSGSAGGDRRFGRE
jgi:hypothetical protein